MADFPWQKPSRDDDVSRFPWQASGALGEPDAPAETADPPTSMPWKRQNPPAEASKAVVVRQSPAPDTREPRGNAKHDSAEQADIEQADAEQTSSAADQAERQRAAFMRAAHQQQGSTTDGSATPASSSMPWQNHDDVPEPSTYTPPWQPASSSAAPAARSHTKKPRPTPRTSAAAPVAPPAKVRVATGRAGKALGTVVFSAVAAVIVFGVGAALFVPKFGSGSSSGAAGAAPSPTPTVITRATDEIALDTANAFIDALVSGDADGALAMLGASASELTSSDAWKGMLEAYPITDVSVISAGVDSWDAQLIEIGYTMNEQSISFTMTVDVDLTAPENTVIDYDLPTLNITDGYEGFDVTLNGVPLANTSDVTLDVFPGVYTVATTTAYFAIKSDSIIVSEGINFLYPYDHEPALTDEGVAKFREVVRAAVEACISATTLEAGCGLTVSGGLAGGGSIVDGSVERTITDEQWDEIDTMVPTADTWDGGLVQEGNSIGVVSFFADWNQNGSWGRDEIHGGPWLDSPHVDFADPEFTVTWEF